MRTLFNRRFSTITRSDFIGRPATQLPQLQFKDAALGVKVILGALSTVLSKGGILVCLNIVLCGSSLLNFSKKYLRSYPLRGEPQQLSFIFLSAFLMIPASAFCDESDWSIGGYGGQYYHSEPAGLLTNQNATFLSQYIIALTASRTVWRSKALPLSLEIDGMVGQQFGLASLSEIAIAPVLRWSSFPWKETLQTDFRFGPFGASYTTSVSPLERGIISGKGSRTLNFLLIEAAFSLPQMKSKEAFVRLHHRSAIYDSLNDDGANGEDFLVLGYRRHF